MSSFDDFWLQKLPVIETSRIVSARIYNIGHLVSKTKLSRLVSRSNGVASRSRITTIIWCSTSLCQDVKHQRAAGGAAAQQLGAAVT